MYTTYKDRDNTFAIQLVKNGVAFTSSEMQAITKVELLFKEVYYNSTDHPSAFDWTTRESEGVVIFSLGTISAIVAGRDKGSELIIYSSDYTDGVVWGLLDINVIELVGT